jgi:hypothetical protein
MKPVGHLVGEAMLDRDVVPIDVAEASKALEEPAVVWPLFVRAAGVPENADPWNLARLPTLRAFGKKYSFCCPAGRL